MKNRDGGGLYGFVRNYTFGSPDSALWQIQAVMGSLMWNKTVSLLHVFDLPSTLASLFHFVNHSRVVSYQTDACRIVVSCHSIPIQNPQTSSSGNKQTLVAKEKPIPSILNKYANENTI